MLTLMLTEIFKIQSETFNVINQFDLLSSSQCFSLYNLYCSNAIIGTVCDCINHQFVVWFLTYIQNDAP